MSALKSKKAERFGFDPSIRPTFVKVATVQYQGKPSQFEFFYYGRSRRIEVCYLGCNGTYLSGIVVSDTKTTLPAEFSKAFLRLKNPEKRR